MNLCAATLLATTLAAVGLVLRIASLRHRGITLTIAPNRANGHRHPEALHNTHIEYEDWS